MFNKKNCVAWISLLASVLATLLVGYHVAFLGGLFKSSNAELQFGQHRLIADRPVQFYYATGTGTRNSDIIFIPIVFTIANTGDLALKDVKATIRITPASACMPETFRRFVRAKGGLMEGEMAHDRNTDSQGCSVMYKFNSLNANQAVSVADAVITQPATDQHDFFLQVAQQGHASVSLTYANGPIKKYTFTFWPVSSSTLSSLIEWYKMIYLPADAIRTRHETTITSYIINLLSGSKKTAILVKVPFGSFTQNNMTLRMPVENTTEAVLVESSIYSPSLLFQNND